MDLLKPPVHDGRMPAYVPKEVEFIKGDVRDPECMRRALRDVTVVYHMAAYQDYLPDFSTFFTTNAGGTALLYELILAEFRQVELVVVASSQSVYGEGKYACAGDGAVYPGPRPRSNFRMGSGSNRCPPVRGPGARPDRRIRHASPTAYGLSSGTGRHRDVVRTALPLAQVAFRYSIVQGRPAIVPECLLGALASFTGCW